MSGATTPRVLITGAASGIGLGLTHVCLKQNMQVIMVDNHGIKLKEAAKRLQTEYQAKVETAVCDVTSFDQINQLAQQIQSPLTAIYNNAGILGPLGPIWSLDPRDIQHVFDVNIMGMVHVIQAFVPLLLQQHVRAHIINMASLYAVCSGSQVGAYAMSKHAVLALSESLYFDVQRLKAPIDVSVAFPSFTDTALVSHAKEPTAFHQALARIINHAKPAIDVAEHIVSAAAKKQFYIFPDAEVKNYAQARMQNAIVQDAPHAHSIEQLIQRLSARMDSER